MVLLAHQGNPTKQLHHQTISFRTGQGKQGPVSDCDVPIMTTYNFWGTKINPSWFIYQFIESPILKASTSLSACSIQYKGESYYCYFKQHGVCFTVPRHLIISQMEKLTYRWAVLAWHIDYYHTAGHRIKNKKNKWPRQIGALDLCKLQEEIREKINQKQETKMRAFFKLFHKLNHHTCVFKYE